MGKARQKRDHVPVPVEKKETIRRELLSWYRENRRDLPWRRERDPYRIWVSEVMLQQTRVDTVIPYYERFLEQFPTLSALAEAPEEQVIKVWEGLGYYSRARNLHAAVKEVAARYGGKVPDDPEEIATLKGVGPYTAGAILSIAYNKKAPAVDGNVMRVFSRLFALEDDIARVATRKKMERIAVELIPEEAPGDFNQALMELGALICTPVSPQCLFCPVQTVCDAFRLGMEQELPRKKKAKSPRPVDVIFAVLRADGRTVAEKRPDDGLFGGMWGLPTLEYSTREDPLETVRKLCDTNRIPVTNLFMKGVFTHIFSHLHWKVVVVEVRVAARCEELPEGWHWVEESELRQKPFSNVYRKAFQYFSW
jgi:A/G-specific adenine glycosylase